MRGRFVLVAPLVAALALVGCGNVDRVGTLADPVPSCSYSTGRAKITNPPSSLSRVNFNYAASTQGGAQSEYHTKYGATDYSVPSWARVVSIFVYDTSGGLLLSWTFVGCT